MNFNLNEQIFLRNEKTNKVYTITLNQRETPKSYDVTREWTVPNQPILAAKTDRFFTFKQAADFLQLHYNERISNGYIEVMRRPGIQKTAAKIEEHKRTETISTQKDGPLEPPKSGLKVQERISSRQITSIHDRLNILKPPQS